MQELRLDEEQLRNFIPKAAQRRWLILLSIVAELKRRRFRSLDAANPNDLSKVTSIVSDMYPEATKYKAREYAQVSIGLWRKMIGGAQSRQRPPATRTRHVPKLAQAKSDSAKVEQ